MTIELLRFTTAGSVDDGKSTLIGRMLYDTKSLFEDQIALVEETSQQRGDSYVDLALFTDGLRAEREQKITIDVAYRYFATPRRRFIIADTPGHIQYTRNMVTGASTAELAIVLIDARKGVQTQSKRHGFIATLLRIPHIVVAVNKMDLVDYDEAVYRRIVEQYTEFVAQLNAQDVTSIPVSALAGDNVVDKSDNMPWYEGPTLLHHLEHVNVGAGQNHVDFRYPVQYVLRPNQNFRGYAGQIVSGRISPGEEVVVFPSGFESRIKEIVTLSGNLDEAKAGDSVTLTLDDEIDISRGDMIVRKGNLPQKSNDIDATICWMSEEPLDLGKTYQLQHTTRLLRTIVRRLNYRIDVDTMHREDVATLALNEIGRVQLTTTQPLFYDRYELNRGTGSFILIDPATNNTVAAGMIRDEVREVDDLRDLSSDAQEMRRRRQEQVARDTGGISLAERETLSGHPAAVVWFTGLSGSGKSTIAKQLERKLFGRGVHTMFLEGDSMRHGLSGDLGFSPEDRAEHIRRVAEVASLGFAHANVVLCSCISPYSRDREYARSIVPDGRFFEIFVKCDLQVLKRRDPKGLYARALSGEIKHFTGVSAPYEEPGNAELVVETDVDTVDVIVERLLALLEQAGIVPKA